MERDNTGSVMGWCITQFQVIAIKREMETDALWSTLFFINFQVLLIGVRIWVVFIDARWGKFVFCSGKVRRQRIFFISTSPAM